ncbi:MAG: FAD-dependent oxidoreductase [Glaciimonas sp.]|nr:FAD-dependent oxidoreductase [Glaciimonas sp.]
MQCRLAAAEWIRRTVLEPARKVAGGLYFPDLASGDRTLFTKQLKALANASGVQFHFDLRGDTMNSQDGRVALRIGDNVLHADAVVVAAGMDIAALLKNLGIKVLLQVVKTYTVKAAVKNHDVAPKLAL